MTWENVYELCFLFRKKSRLRFLNSFVSKIFFSIWVFFQNDSRITGLQGMGEGIPLTPHYHFHPLHRHLDNSRAITERAHFYTQVAAGLESGTFGFRAQVANHWATHLKKIHISYFFSASKVINKIFRFCRYICCTFSFFINKKRENENVDLQLFIKVACVVNIKLFFYELILL